MSKIFRTELAKVKCSNEADLISFDGGETFGFQASQPWMSITFRFHQPIVINDKFCSIEFPSDILGRRCLVKFYGSKELDVLTYDVQSLDTSSPIIDLRPILLLMDNIVIIRIDMEEKMETPWFFPYLFAVKEYQEPQLRVNPKGNMIPGGDFALGLSQWANGEVWQAKGEWKTSFPAPQEMRLEPVGDPAEEHEAVVATWPLSVTSKSTYYWRVLIQADQKPIGYRCYWSESDKLEGLGSWRDYDREGIIEAGQEVVVHGRFAAKIENVESTLRVVITGGGVTISQVEARKTHENRTLWVNGPNLKMNGHCAFYLGHFGLPDLDPQDLSAFDLLIPRAMVSPYLSDLCDKYGIGLLADLSGAVRYGKIDEIPRVFDSLTPSPAWIGVYLCDEPDHGEKRVTVQQLREARERAPAGYPTFVTVMGWDHDPARNMLSSRAAQYQSAADVIMQEIYPYTTGKGMDWARDLARWVRRVVTKPLLAVIEFSEQMSVDDMKQLINIPFEEGYHGIFVWNHDLDPNSQKGKEVYEHLLRTTKAFNQQRLIER